MIEIEHKKKAYVAPEIEVVMCEASELMAVSGQAQNQGQGEGGNIPGSENAKLGLNSGFRLIEDDESFGTDVVEVADIDEVLSRFH